MQTLLHSLAFDRPCNNFLDQAARADRNPLWKFDSAAFKTYRVHIHIPNCVIVGNLRIFRKSVTASDNGFVLHYGD